MQPTIQLEKLQDYKAVCFGSVQLPLLLVKPPKVEQNQEEKLEKVKFEILVLVYRSLEAKGNLLEELYVKYPDLSKKTLERFLKDNTLKEKREGDPVAAYHLLPEQMALLDA